MAKIEITYCATKFMCKKITNSNFCHYKLFIHFIIQCVSEWQRYASVSLCVHPEAAGQGYALATGTNRQALRRLSTKVSSAANYRGIK